MTALEKTSLTIPLEITLRLATKSDLPKLEWYGLYKHYRTLFRRTFQEQQLGRRLMLIADSNDFPVGHIFIHLNKRNDEGRAYLYSFRVMEMFQGKGIGTRLIEEAETLAFNHGFYWTTIAVAKENNAARRLYERLGYCVYGDDAGRWSYIDHEGRTRHVHEPCWLLEKRLMLW
jgi:GNAT superfamily N-acetyltransferase